MRRRTAPRACQSAVTSRYHRSDVPALLALFAGALAIGSSGIFVRLSETGPTATAFWRGAFALPLLAVWAWLERRREPQQPRQVRNLSCACGGPGL